ncbi:enoyl-CoA hydratase [Hydrocarboniclastica marina]|uniref:enoyl-CoA hydratase n=1 Tax=Hydrocarboniclastica marina TaxID=2259620 RepID=A0A4P7XJ87_9ALTE|nr:enoyl-CoA hydratase [Hydrocarboniclastica marina]MAL97276.1 enoyl-CoA hydratase [Alteromonadaceae bacterium]QCF27179.1 enoyl-CoA hydratase [Hydrocarboniclastica marina]|tara:strand:+ start:465 stop:1241 length:777 start_codon:yes stop_codon:yes gene_type:complete
MDYNTLLFEMRGKVALITLNRPEALNALSPELTAELTDLLDQLETDDNVAVVVLTGSEKAFAAGADIKAMKDWSYMDVYKADFITATWERISRFRKPTIAAVNGYALGGGCELAMMCDFIIASETARFGQPEITIGTIPGAGGTQRLARFIGKAKAMDMILTGRMMDAQEAERSGLVSRVLPSAELVEGTLKVAEQIARLSSPIAMMAKEAVDRAFETTLSEGIRFERRLFHSTFATRDQKEGMSAFSEKRKPQFNND